jgi:hypothetical protein
MAKFQTKDLQDLKAWQKQIKPYLKKIEKLNTTVKYWNTKGHMAVLNNHAYDIQDLINYLKGYLIEYKKLKQNYSENNFGLAENLSARGWHKDHNNYNKAEKHELPPSLRRTPARNVTKTGAKRKRATTVKKYKK